ncbi:aliphatic sulfonate ABC transporter substrate-binding protein [Cellulosilyticum ruminicola]|uniref:aliphatic sulfonate ABC transporter substrate-binding protein n=1 Tax=Cellulosilyticum ruminicola TaxID=425254 RepID=UPI0006D04D42|nr:aliphatic sulfonate ABC transporter substrate-binding protein [Cellulosilyticum ruminicola]
MKNRVWKKGLVKMITLITSTLLIGAVMTGCGKAATASNEGQETSQAATSLNVAIQPAVGFLPAYILKDENLLQNALKEANYGDVTVNFTEFESGPPENEAFASGLQDIGVIGNVPAVSAIASGQERKLIGISYNGEQTLSVLVGKDSEITKVEDLVGKKIGLVVGSFAQNFLYNVLKANNLSINDVELINLSTGEQIQALTSNQVDALATWEPTITKAQAQDVGKILVDGTGVFLGENPIIARTQYVEANPEITQIFLDTYKKAVDELAANTEQYAEKYADQFGIDKDLLITALSHAREPVVITKEDAKDLQETVEFLKASDIITKDLNIEDYIDYSFSENIKE